jgi:hypothetical protein
VCEVLQEITIRNLSVLSMMDENMRCAMLYIEKQEEEKKKKEKKKKC